MLAKTPTRSHHSIRALLGLVKVAEDIVVGEPVKRQLKTFSLLMRTAQAKCGL